MPTTFGMGFMTYGPFTPYAGPGSFGHPGAGGSVAFAQPERELAFAYAMNKMAPNLAADVRAQQLIAAATGIIDGLVRLTHSARTVGAAPLRRVRMGGGARHTGRRPDLMGVPDGNNEWLIATGRRRRRRRRRVRRPVHAPPAARAGLLGDGARVGRRRRRHVVLEPLPGRPLRHPDHRLHLHVRPRAGDRRGRGRRSTPPSRRSCATCSTSPTSTTCAATSGSRRGSPRRRGTTPPSLWRITTDSGDDDHLPLLRHGDGLPVDAEGARHRGRRPLRRRGVLHEPLAPRGRRLHRQAGRRHRHRLVGHPVDPADRRAGRRADRLPAHAELLAAGPQRPAAGRAPGRARRGSPAPTARPPAGRAAASRSRPPLETGAPAVAGGAAGPLRGGVGGRRAVRHPRHVRRRADRTGTPTRSSPR